MKRLLASLLPLLLVGGPGCKSEPPPPPPMTVAPAPTTTLPALPSVTSVTLGSAIGADKRVLASAESFGAKDTIYASVETAGTGHLKLRALWSFVKGDKKATVDETTLELDSMGPAVNEFHVAKPSGWPKGAYKLEIFLNDSSAAAVVKAFTVA